MNNKVVEITVRDEQKEIAKMAAFVESLAKLTDKAMVQAAAEKEIELDEYVAALKRIGEHTDDLKYDTAFELMLQLASLLDSDAKVIVENLETIHADAKVVFLDYFYEYILDWYEFEMIFQQQQELEEEDKKTETVLDGAYRMIKEMMKCEVKNDDQCEGDCDL